MDPNAEEIAYSISAGVFPVVVDWVYLQTAAVCPHDVLMSDVPCDSA